MGFKKFRFEILIFLFSICYLILKTGDFKGRQPPIYLFLSFKIFRTKKEGER